MIKEHDPPFPSHRARSSTTTKEIGDQRKTDSYKLGKILKGDLDCIVMCAISKDRDQRYESANNLGKDVSRFLKHEEIEARPPAVTYKLKKFLRRNRIALGTMAVVASSAIFGVIVLLELARVRGENDTLAEQNTQLTIKNSELTALGQTLIPIGRAIISANPESKIRLAEDGISSYKKLDDLGSLKRDELVGYHSLASQAGNACLELDNKQQAAKYFKLAITLSERIRDIAEGDETENLTRVAKDYMNLGNAENNKANNLRAIELLESGSVDNKITRLAKARSISNSTNSLPIKERLDPLLEGLELIQNDGDSKELFEFYDRLAVCYEHRNEKQNATAFYDKAEQLALRQLKKSPDSWYYRKWLARVYYNRGFAELNTLGTAENFAKAYAILRNADRTKFDDNLRQMYCMSLINRGLAAFNNKTPLDALLDLDKGVEAMKEMEFFQRDQMLPHAQVQLLFAISYYDELRAAEELLQLGEMTNMAAPGVARFNAARIYARALAKTEDQKSKEDYLSRCIASLEMAKTNGGITPITMNTLNNADEFKEIKEHKRIQQLLN